MNKKEEEAFLSAFLSKGYAFDKLTWNPIWFLLDLMEFSSKREYGYVGHSLWFHLCILSLFPYVID